MLYLNSANIKSLSSVQPDRYQILKDPYRIVKLTCLLQRFLPHDQVLPVRSAVELQEAQQLVYREYRSSTLCTERNSELYYTPHTLLPTSAVICARYKQKLLGACSIIPDSAFGLPSDELYKNELDQMRADGCKLVEVGALSVDRKQARCKSRSLRSVRKLNLLMNLFSGAFCYAMNHFDATHIIIIVHDKHRHLYEMIGFEQFSEIRFYEKVQNIALPMRIDMKEFVSAYKKHLPSMYMKNTMSEMIPRQEYKSSIDDLIFRMAKDRDYFLNLPPKDIKRLTVDFPKFPLLLNAIRKCGACATRQPHESSNCSSDSLEKRLKNLAITNTVIIE